MNDEQKDSLYFKRELLKYTFGTMKITLSFFKVTGLFFILSASLFLGAGCNRSGSYASPELNSEFKTLMAEATQVKMHITNYSGTEVVGNKTSTTMSFDERDIALTSKDAKGFADNLAVGRAFERAEILKVERFKLTFTTPNGKLIWLISPEEAPGVLEILKNDRPIRVSGEASNNDDCFELSEEANTFALNWYAAQMGGKLPPTTNEVLNLPRN